MSWMFYGNDFFNYDISVWDTSSVLNMDRMFNNNDIFNYDITSWVVTQVTDCIVFNGGTSVLTSGNRPDFAGQGSSCTP